MGNLGYQELLLFVVFFLLFYFVVKRVIVWLFGINKRDRYAEAQIRLLMHIAAKQGVDPDKIAEIVAEADLPNFKKND
ncbi:MAG: hypothetical protein CFE25_08745 [Chitinophagaceae bacterium BSSC1]|nr:MAG: hypothetical protein CFE25_08745 [Chitinophagaceae bacterium BSSC1]